MKKRIVLASISIILCLFVFISYTYSWLSYQEIKQGTYEIGEVSINVVSSSNGVLVEDDIISVNDLVYIDLIKDLKEDRYNALNGIASTIEIEATNLSDIEVLFQVKLEKDNGLLLLLCNSDVTDYKTVVDLSTANDSSSIRTLIEEHNYNFLKNYCEISNVKNKDEKISFKIAIFGDYDNLTNTEKESYLDLTFNLKLDIKAIQNFGGVIYEEDY